MKMMQPLQNEMEGKKLLSLLVVSGICFSAISFIVLNDDVIASSESLSKSGVPVLCENGLCNPIGSETKAIGNFIQQGNDVNSIGVAANVEVFTDLKFVKNNVQKQDFKISGNKVTLFAEKDSFIREVVKSSNEGSSEVLRVMGTEGTNNRAMLAFDQTEIESLTQGKNLESATLKLYVESNDGNWKEGQMINIYHLRDNWIEGTGANTPFGNLVGSEEGITWNCSSDSTSCTTKWNGGYFEETPTDSLFISNHVKDGYWIKFDVTDDVNDYLSGSPNFGWIILKSEEDKPGRINFASREAQSNIPELVLVLSK